MKRQRGKTILLFVYVFSWTFKFGEGRNTFPLETSDQVISSISSWIDRQPSDSCFGIPLNGNENGGTGLFSVSFMLWKFIDYTRHTLRNLALYQSNTRTFRRSESSWHPPRPPGAQPQPQRPRCPRPRQRRGSPRSVRVRYRVIGEQGRGGDCSKV